ncbi:MAG: fasciclin domain-containing protein [Candidatus Kaiserbacteria bacterium]|nr:MAG: fasciclin domain-containing protein [Candidatus Kaiserbacteria bacterium]
MQQNNQVWVGGIALAIVAVLGLWWLAASQGVNLAGLNLPPRIDTATTPGNGTGSGDSTVSTSNRAGSDVLSIVRSIEGGSEFSALLSSTGVSSQIRRTGQYTIFVPTNSALNTSGMTAAEKKRLAQYHVVSGRAIDPDAVSSGTIETLSRDSVNFTVNDTDGTARINSSYIIRAYRGTNGVVFLVSGYLIPPEPNPAF